MLLGLWFTVGPLLLRRNQEKSVKVKIQIQRRTEARPCPGIVRRDKGGRKRTEFRAFTVASVNASIKGEKYAIAFRIHLSHSTRAEAGGLARACTRWSIRIGRGSEAQRPSIATSLIHTSHSHNRRGDTLYSNGARRRRERGKCRFRKIYLNRRGQLNCGRKRKREEGTCVRNVLVNCFKRRHSIFNFENNSRPRSVLSLSPGRASAAG